MSYILPQVEVFQMFKAAPAAVVQNLNAFIFGPQYQLFRYSVAAEKALIGLGAYDPSDVTTYAWPSQPAGSVVDTGYAKLYAEALWADYLDMDVADSLEVVSDVLRNHVHCASMIFAEANGYARSARLLSRDVKVGDGVTYAYSNGGNTYTGTTKVAALLADNNSSVINTPSNKASNHASVVATNLSGGSASAFAAAAGNTYVYASSRVWGLGLNDEFLGSLAAGTTNDVITVTITYGGAAGTALASVAYASGSYSRTNVPIEAVAYAEGQVYIGNNAYLKFVTAAAETVFSAGDVYTVTVNGAFTKLAFTSITVGNIVMSGTYTGPKDTTYLVEVIRGGLFGQIVSVIPGLTVPTATLAVNPGASASPDWTDWLGGYTDDEYVLTCTTGGLVTAAKFSLTSQNGDDQTNISFGSSGHETSIGSLGLVASMTTTDTFAVGDSWVIRVNASLPQIRVTDSAGIDSTSVITIPVITTAHDIGNYGVKIAFAANSNTEGGVVANGGLRLGDVYYVSVTPAMPGAMRTIVLADTVDVNIPSATPFAMSLYLTQNGVQIPAENTIAGSGFNWVASADSLVVNPGIQVLDASWYDGAGVPQPLNVYTANLFVEYRALMSTYAAAISSLQDLADVATTLGAVTPDNPLAQGVYNALLNSGSQPVYFMAVPTDDLAGYNTVLKAATLSNLVYSLAPLSQEDDVLAAVQAHVNAMSTETAKHWRVAFVGTKMPVSRVVYNQASNPIDDNFYSEIALDSVTGAYTLLSFVDAAGNPSIYTKCTTDLTAGDQIVIFNGTDIWGNISTSTYLVKTVLNNTQVRLVTGPAAAIDVPTKTEAWHPYTLDEMVTAFAARSQSFYSRRMYNVFPPQMSEAGVVQTSPFGAAALAGLVSSVLPQQPLTNVQVVGFDDLPLVYQTFSASQLNVLAGAGTLIIMQDTAGGEVYVRHQVSTAGSSGDLNQTELSITKNLDSISYYFAGRFAPYIGKYNVTPNLINMINLILIDGINYLGSLTGVGLIGPQVILDNSAVVSVTQDPSAADRVIAIVNLELPAPFNVLQLELVV